MLGEIRQMMEDMSPEDDRDFSWYRVNIFTVVSPVVSNCKWILGILESSGIQRVSVQLYEQSLGRAGRTLSGHAGRGEQRICDPLRQIAQPRCKEECVV